MGCSPRGRCRFCATSPLGRPYVWDVIPKINTRAPPAGSRDRTRPLSRLRAATYPAFVAESGLDAAGLDRLELPIAHGEGRFVPADDGGTSVEFDIDFQFKSRLLEALLKANFAHAVDRLMTCFEDRARSLYGETAAARRG